MRPGLRARMQPSRLDNAAHGHSNRLSVMLQGRIGQRDNANETFITVDDGQTAHLDVAHVLDNMLYVLVLVAVFHIASHHVPDMGAAALALRKAPHNDIAISDGPDEAVVFGDRQEADVLLG